ncbi:MAG: glycerol-3-phosphate 1-O-acyltransferase PlsY [Gracilibacteraceae bacterium]|jgi:glycerol-3-phosphate acyltransferase PlsY|nr:glycerol-3-phosphate 1-O-acyltransferase PlsY [Gracilibacteraceae bacterium]
MWEYLVFPLAYLLGAFPSAWLAGRAAGTDVRKAGSGNMGATNALRVLGKRWGLAVFAADIVKGGLAAWLTLNVFGPWGGVAGGMLALLAHSFNPFFGFKPSGKGAASGLGVVIILMPKETVAALAVFCVVLAVWRYVSLASITAAFTLLAAMFIFREPPPLLVFGLAGVALLVGRHRANIERLRAGTEPKIGEKGTAQKE